MKKVGIFLLAFAFTWLHSYRHNPCLMDYTSLLNRAFRIYKGQIPYINFNCMITPLTFYTQAGLWKVFGVSLTVSRVYMAVFDGVLAVCVYLFLKARVESFVALGSTLLFIAWAPYVIARLPMYVADANGMALLGGLALFKGWKWAGWGFILLSLFYEQNVGIAAICCGFLL